MDVESQMVSAALRLLLRWRHDVPWGGLLAVTVIWHLYRKARYSSEGWRRERARVSKLKREHAMQLRETVTTTLAIFSQAPRPRLKDLAEDSETDFQLKS